jgi:hypothetical protein
MAAAQQTTVQPGKPALTKLTLHIWAPSVHTVIFSKKPLMQFYLQMASIIT